MNFNSVGIGYNRGLAFRGGNKQKSEVAAIKRGRSMRSRLVVSISIVAAVMAGGMLIINGSGASVRAERANTASTPVACPGTTTIGSVVITCSGSGSQEVATVDRPIGCDGCAKGQAQELTITDTRAGGGTGTGHGSTISSVAVSETDGTTASGVVTLHPAHRVLLEAARWISRSRALPGKS
jgi:hypothetical protein